MRVLVTGGAGYIGSHACIAMLEKGHSVIIYDNFSNSSQIVPSRINQISSQKVDCIVGDINDNLKLRNTFKRFMPDIVVHFAGLKSVKESTEKPLDYYKTNVGGTLNILDCMECFDCRRIVFSSSATVYGIPEYLPFDEKHPVYPINPYGETKAMCEKLIRDWVYSQKSKSAVCLRYFNPIGAHESGLIGEDPRGIPNNIMPIILQVAIGKREHLDIYGCDYETRDGTGERDYVHVMDIAEAHVEAMTQIEKQSDFEVFNLGTGCGTTVRELVINFENVTGIKIPCVKKPRRPGDVARSWSSTERSKVHLRMHNSRSIEKMCQDSWNWVSKNPNGYER